MCKPLNSAADLRKLSLQYLYSEQARAAAAVRESAHAVRREADRKAFRAAARNALAEMTA